MDDKSTVFQDLPLHIPDELIAEIFHQAWAEALAEARQLLKQKMLQTILARSLASSPSLFSPVTEEAKPAAPLSTSPLADRKSFKTKERIMDEEETKPMHSIWEEHPNVPISTLSPDDRGSSADTKRIQEEIEDIRQKLGQNEQLLQQIKTPPAPPANPEPAARDESPVVAADGVVVPVPAAQSRFQRGSPGSSEAVPVPARGTGYGARGVGYYVYCVEGNDSPHPELPQEGIDPAYPLYTITDHTLRAVVSQVSLQEFGEAALELNLHDSAWLESRVRCHQDVLEGLSSTGNVVPMRFCTIYLSEARVQEMLTLYHDKFTKALDHLAGRQEWGVKAYYDKDLLAHHVEETDESILSLKAEGSGKSSGQAYFTKKKLAETIVEHVERTSDAYAQDSHNRLTTCAVAASLLQVQTKEASGRQEEMVLNGAYLIDKEKITLFRAELEKLGNEYSPSGFSYGFTGPWPPYNFVNIGEEERLDE